MNLWDYNKRYSIHVIRVPEGEEKDLGRAEKVLEK